MRCSPLPLKLGVSVVGQASDSGLVLQNNGGDDLSITASGGYAFATPLANNAAYTVTILHQPTGQSCFLRNATGMVIAGTIVTVVCPWHVAYVVYAMNAAEPNTIAGFYIDEKTGAFVAGPAALSTGSSPSYVTVTPNNRFCYVANAGDGTVSGYSIEATDGTLTPVSGSPVSAGTRPVQITVAPSGQYAYVANAGSNDISVYAINSSTGALTSIPGSPFTTGLGATAYTTDIAIDPSGAFAFVATGPSLQIIEGFAVTAGTGALAALASSPINAGNGPEWIAFTPNGKYMYVQDFLGTTSAFAFDSTSGALAPVPGSPFSGGGYLLSLAVDPLGRFVYLADTGLNQILAYSIDPQNGALVPMAGSPYASPLGASPHFITPDPSGMYAYVTYYNGSNGITAYAVDSGGNALAALPDTSFQTTLGASSVAVAALR